MNLSPTMQSSTQFSRLDNIVLTSVSSTTGVELAKILSSVKMKEVVIARSIVCVLLDEYGYGKREIGRIVNVDQKSVHISIDSHDNRMADRKYATAYHKSKRFVEDYESSNENLEGKVNSLYTKYVELESKYEHLVDLLTSN